MKTLPTTLLLTLLSLPLTLSAPNPQKSIKETISQNRRDRFLASHAAKVRAATLSYTPTVSTTEQHAPRHVHHDRHHQPFLAPRRESLPEIQAQSPAAAQASHHHHSASFQNDTVCPEHHPFVRSHTRPPKIKSKPKSNPNPNPKQNPNPKSKSCSHNSAVRPNNTRNIDYSGNWCGIVQQAPPGDADTDKFISVSATWTMPTLSAPSDSSQPVPADNTYYGSQWVGIDGYTYGAAILQAGTTSAVTISPDGTPINSASAWFEWYPDPETPISSTDFPVSPGDTISCSVSAINSTTGTVVLENVSTGAMYTTDFAAPGDDAALGGVNAEWIYEDFSAGGLVPFAAFSPVVFEGCEAMTAAGESVGLGGGTVVDLVAGSEVLCNAVATDGAAMTVAYGPAA